MSQFYFATFTSTNSNVVTLATSLTATTCKSEPIRQMKRKPDQLQSKLQAVLQTTTFNMALKKRERKPDNIQNSIQMTLSTKFNFKFATLPIFHQKETYTYHTFIQQNQAERKNLKK
jgi:hypothetical protein